MNMMIVIGSGILLATALFASILVLSIAYIAIKRLKSGRSDQSLSRQEESN